MPIKNKNMQEKDRKWLAEIQQIVQTHIEKENFTTAMLANDLAISSSTLHRRILQLTDLSPLKYIRQWRLQQAKALIETGQYATVKSIAAAVGFTNVTYFSRQFIALYKISPAQLMEAEKVEKTK